MSTDFLMGTRKGQAKLAQMERFGIYLQEQNSLLLSSAAPHLAHYQELGVSALRSVFHVLFIARPPHTCAIAAFACISEAFTSAARTWSIVAIDRCPTSVFAALSSFFFFSFSLVRAGGG